MENKFDEIGYTQILFRTLLDCMARPGKIGRIKPATCGLNCCFNDYVLGVAVTLLDQEVTFHIFKDRHNSSAQLQIYTLSRHRNIEECDYLLVDGKENFDIQRLKKGSLKFPDESATVICQVSQLSKEPLFRPGAVKLQLYGPGIQNKQTLYVDGLNEQILKPWQNCNREFPLELDWIFVDQSGWICCIPRSTGFVWEVI